MLAYNAFTRVLSEPLDFRNAALIISVLAVLVIAVWLTIVVLSRRSRAEERPAQNLAKFLPDEDLEDRRLERVLATALFWCAIVAIGLVVYGVFEPTRQADSLEAYDERSVERGAALYANTQSKAYDATASLQCANCHGLDGGGGAANFTVPVDQIPDSQWVALGLPEVARQPVQVQWAAPALNTALLKYPVRKENCTIIDTHTNPDCRSQVYDILVYGRPGTPMPAWGVAGGGAKNDQAINDLIAYIQTLQDDYLAKLAKEGKTTAEAADALVQPIDMSAARAALSLPDDQWKAAFSAATSGVDASNLFVSALQSARKVRTDLAADQAKLAEAQKTPEYAAAVAALDKAQADYAAAKAKNDANAMSAAQSAATDLIGTAKAPGPLYYKYAVAGDQYMVGVTDARLAELEPLGQRAAAGDPVAKGALLFQTNCGRCHTRNWSITLASPTQANAPRSMAQGSGAFGPSLVDGATLRQFVDAPSQVQFVTQGSQYQKPYGVRGIGSGRMPAFGQWDSSSKEPGVLSDEQIADIVAYERSLGVVAP